LGAMARSNAGAAVGCLLAALLQPCAVVAQVRVMSPDWLVRKFSNTMGRIEGSTATFGAPFYGDRVLGSLVYGESQLNHQHCAADDYTVSTMEKFGTDSNSQKTRLINIILVRRGKCSFTTKVKVAYDKGAHAVIIVDREDSELTTADMKNIIVADDGFGDKIHIPSVLIAKTEGNKLIEAAKSGQVLVELAWDLPTDHIVVTDLWMSSASQVSLKFLKEFSPKRRVLNEVMIFQPHYAVFGMDGSNPQIYNGLCSDDSGQFCAEDPDGAGPIKGKDVLDEDVRQLCIHMVHKVLRSTEASTKAGKPGVEYAAKYWDYVEQLLDSCPLGLANPQDRFGTECSTRLMNKVGIDVPRVAACVRVNTTSYLKAEREHQAWSPRALRINGWRYSGILDADLVMRAICSGFVTQPTECADLMKKRDPFVPYFEPKPEGVTFLQMLMWLLGVCLVLFGSMLLYKRYLKKEMRTTLREEVMLEVQAQMGEYQKMMGSS